MGLACGGAILMVISSEQAEEGNQHNAPMFASFVPIIQCICFSAYLLLQKKYIYEAPATDPRVLRWIEKPISLTAWVYCVGAITMWLVFIPRAACAPNILHFP